MRPGLHHWGRSGATDGQVPVFNTDADEWEPGTVGSGIDSVIVSVTVGMPSFVFDADSSPVTTEVPS